MMKKTWMLLFCLIFLLGLPGCSVAKKLTPEEQFKAKYPQHTYESFTSIGIDGIFEIYNGKQIYYYLPAQDVFFYGNLVTKDGTNLTRERSKDIMALKMGKLPLASALKIGQGDKTVVKFTDPNCPYCRQGFEFFDARKANVTTYVFLVPLSQDSERKIQHILCSANPAVAYEEVFRGKFDADAKLNLCSDLQVRERMTTHRNMAMDIGLRGTPLFYINGKVVDGFDPAAIEQLLKD